MSDGLKETLMVVGSALVGIGLLTLFGVAVGALT